MLVLQIIAAMEITKFTGFTCHDSVSYRHLELFGPVAIGALTDIFNPTIVHTNIPNIWKKSQNHTPTEPTSYKPISLLFNQVEIYEKLLNTITPHIISSPTQHGFRALHSTPTL